MPRTLDKTNIGKEFDKRRHLTDAQREEIKNLYFVEGLGIRTIARKFESYCTRRNIQFVLFPERITASRINYYWKNYYTKERRKDDMKKHRDYKRLLIQNGLIKRFINNT